MHTNHFFQTKAIAPASVYIQKYELFKFNRQDQGNKILRSVMF